MYYNKTDEYIRILDFSNEYIIVFFCCKIHVQIIII